MYYKDLQVVNIYRVALTIKKGKLKEAKLLLAEITPDLNEVYEEDRYEYYIAVGHINTAETKYKETSNYETANKIALNFDNLVHLAKAYFKIFKNLN